MQDIKLTKIENSQVKIKRTWHSVYHCSCGEYKLIAEGSVNSGLTRSCGCLNRKLAAKRKTTHGKSKTSLYNSWRGMRERCDNPNHKSYANYGARGITYPPRWGKFENFLEDMVDGYSEGLEIERKNYDENYSKENCCWTNDQRQAYNQGFRLDNKSGVVGVRSTKTGMWQAYISKDRKFYDLGNYRSKKDAIITRLKAELKLYGDVKTINKAHEYLLQEVTNGIQD